jgi:hypothetical protein
MLQVTEIQQAVARGWTYPSTEKTPMDVNLVVCVTDQVVQYLRAQGLTVTAYDYGADSN